MLNKIKYNKDAIIVVLIFMFFALAFNIYRVQGDGATHYAFLERVMRVADPESSRQDVESAIFLQSGCAFFNIPFYMPAYLVERAAHTHYDFNGITLRQIAVNLAANFYMILSLLLMTRILKRLCFKSSVLPILAVLFSTTAFSAAVLIPSWSHTVDIFVTTLFIYMLIGSSDRPAVRCIWIGMLFVISMLVRYPNFVLAVMAVLYYLCTKEYKKILFFMAGAISVVWVIPLLLYSYNGTADPFSNMALPCTSSYAQLLFPRYFLKLLVHPLHGLFVWSPVTVLSIFGLLQFPKNQERIGYAMLTAWVVYVIVCSHVFEWHAGWSFSNRYLVSFFPVYVIGLSRMIDRYGKRIVPVVLILMFYSIFLFFNWYQNIMHGEFGTPADMFYNWAKGKSDTSMAGTVNLKTFFSRIWTVCRYKHIFHIFK